MLHHSPIASAESATAVANTAGTLLQRLGLVNAQRFLALRTQTTTSQPASAVLALFEATMFPTVQSHGRDLLGNRVAKPFSAQEIPTVFLVVAAHVMMATLVPSLST